MTDQPTYPYDDGDVTVLGPEIFASKDGEVISWRGENYVRQGDNQPADPAHDAGPTVAEAAADDRRWPLQKEGL